MSTIYPLNHARFGLYPLSNRILEKSSMHEKSAFPGNSQQGANFGLYGKRNGGGTWTARFKDKRPSTPFETESKCLDYSAAAMTIFSSVKHSALSCDIMQTDQESSNEASVEKGSCVESPFRNVDSNLKLQRPLLITSSIGHPVKLHLA